MQRYKMVFSYDGSNFKGYQRQLNLRTVQGCIEEALIDIDLFPVEIYSSGRTDAKVHALNQVAHFDIHRKNIKKDNILYLLQKKVSSDIKITNIEEVPFDFHARFSSVSKEYIFKIKLNKENNKYPFHVKYYAFVDSPIDLKKINNICKEFIGKYDFSSFSKTYNKNDCVREIFTFKCEYSFREDCYLFNIHGSGFLHHMVRFILGFTMDVYNEKEDIRKIKYLLTNKDKKYVNNKFPAEGLYLYKVHY